VIVAIVAIPAIVWPAEESSLRPNDPNLPDDYVTVSILSADPGGALYSLAGHIAIRMQCPYHNLDYVFTYESEDASRLVLRFLSGKLKMGLAALSPDQYLSNYAEDGRGVKEYKVNMPLAARQNLWRILDEHLEEGMELPYDYLERGCAQSTVNFLKEGLDTLRIEYGLFPEHFNLTRCEITQRQLSKYSWSWAFMNLICNKPIDEECSMEQKIIMPADFIEVMGNATVCGEPFLEAPVQLLESKTKPNAAGFTPLHLSLILLLLTIICVFCKSDVMAYVLLAIQTLIGAISTYLVFFSSLCCTEWSWLLVPFNLLPLIFWKWRKCWTTPFGIICLVWAAVMSLLPHKMTDWPYIVLAVSIGVSYLTIGNKCVISRQ